MERYREVKKLGRGRYGEVLLVEKTEDPPSPVPLLYALKRMPLETEDPRHATALQNEVRILSTLQHPNIVGYLESFEHDQCLCIVMEYADGGDLQRQVKDAKKRNIRIEEARVWDWAAQLLQALCYIHDRKIIHRDIKSTNVFLTESGDLKLGDFGISRVLQSTEDLALSNVGTPYYLAPEICTGAGYDQRADLWSLGCLLYELCMLRRPFEGQSLTQIINKVLGAVYEPMDEFYSEDMRRLVNSLLQKDPSTRGTATHFLAFPQISERIPHPKPDICSIPVDFETRKSSKKPFYQREISIRIPTPTSAQNPPSNKEPNSAPPVSPESPEKEVRTRSHGTQRKVTEGKEGGDTEKAESSRCFTFSESVLKQCPSSPNRPILMGDFLKRKLGTEMFEKVKQMVLTLPDPSKTMKEQPWVFSEICGEANLSIVDVGIAFDAFRPLSRVPYPPTSTSKAGFRKFPVLRKPAND